MKTLEKSKSKHVDIKRHGRRKSPSVSEQEDRLDVAAARKALADPQRIPYGEVLIVAVARVRHRREVYR